MILNLIYLLTRMDESLFRFINQTLYWRPLADGMLLLARDQLILLCLLAGAAAWTVLIGWRKALTMAVWGSVAVILCHLIQNNFLKPFFNRPRPFFRFSDMHLCAPLNDFSLVSLAFPSTHAASALALAMVAIQADKRLLGPAAAFVLLLGFGVIYSGGHYPFDVIAGYGVGLMIGGALIQLQRLFPLFIHQTKA